MTWPEDVAWRLPWGRRMLWATYSAGTARVSGMSREGAETVGSTDELGAGVEASRLGFARKQVVQEFGYADDVDEDLRSGIEAIIGSELVDEDYDDVTDGVMLWWRDDDGDLTDALVDVRATLDDGGLIWLLTRKAGRSGHVGHSDIEDSATTAGLHATSTLSIAPDWSATRLDTRGRGR
jgi:hypothetical protein